MSSWLTFLAIYIALLFWHRPRVRPGELPVVTSWIPWVGQALKFKFNTRAALQSWADRHPRGFTLHLCGTMFTVLRSQELQNFFFKVVAVACVLVPMAPSEFPHGGFQDAAAPLRPLLFPPSCFFEPLRILLVLT